MPRLSSPLNGQSNVRNALERGQRCRVRCEAFNVKGRWALVGFIFHSLCHQGGLLEQALRCVMCMHCDTGFHLKTQPFQLLECQMWTWGNPTLPTPHEWTHQWETQIPLIDGRALPLPPPPRPHTQEDLGPRARWALSSVRYLPQY